MKIFAASLTLALALAGTASAATVQEDINQAVAAAEAWMTIVDAGKYGESWDRAAASFQQGVSKAKWEQAVGNVRNPFGIVKSRILMKGDDAPKFARLATGDAVIIQFASAFEKFAPAIEVVTPFREANGTWKISGYFIKPGIVSPPVGTGKAEPESAKSAAPK